MSVLHLVAKIPATAGTICGFWGTGRWGTRHWRAWDVAKRDLCFKVSPWVSAGLVEWCLLWRRQLWGCLREFLWICSAGEHWWWERGVWQTRTRFCQTAQALCCAAVIHIFYGATHGKKYSLVWGIRSCASDEVLTRFSLPSKWFCVSDQPLQGASCQLSLQPRLKGPDVCWRAVPIEGWF